MESVWAELAAAGFSDWRLGVPFNVHRVPDDDVAAVVYGLPLGCYLQGAASHHRLRVFVEALDLVGMTAESAALLDGLAATIADDSSFGGIGSGRDWRMWDGTPSGYEGQLVEGFSVLSCGLRRFSPGSVCLEFVGTWRELASVRAVPVRRRAAKMHAKVGPTEHG